MNTKTTVSNPTGIARYDDMNYPGNRFDIQDLPTYYEVSYSGLARQHDKYQALRRAVLHGVERVLEEAPLSSELAHHARELKHWALGHRGFSCTHMPWRVLIDREQYRMFVYVLRAYDSEAGNAAYSSIRRYGRWV